MGDDLVRVMYNPGNNYPDVSGKGSDTISIIEIVLQPLEDILDSGNNINIKIQENSGNNAWGQSGHGLVYSDSPIL